jgi:hypothetical protein
MMRPFKTERSVAAAKVSEWIHGGRPLAGARSYHWVVGVFIALVGMATAARAADAPFELKDGDRVVFLGDTFIEREQHHGWVELMLTSRFPDHAITFRNLGWSGDTPAGDSRYGLSLLQAGKEPPDEAWNQLGKQIADAKPTLVFVGYGMASSFDGEAGRSKFKVDYLRLLDLLGEKAPGARVVLLSPLPHENLGAPWPDPAAHNQQLAAYARTVRSTVRSAARRYPPHERRNQSADSCGHPADR